MRSRLLLVLLLPFLCAAEPDAKSTDKDIAEFADQLLRVSDVISKDYFIEIPQGQLIEWAVRGLYFRCYDAAVPDEIDERLQKADAKKPEELRKLLTDVRKDMQDGALLDRRYWGGKPSNDRCVDLALEEMSKHLEDTAVLYGGPPFNSEHMPALGVGLRLHSDSSTGLIEIVTPFMNGPAYKSGVRAGDIIEMITFFDQPNGEALKEPKTVSTKGLSAAAALRLLKGWPDTKVRLLVRRPGEEKAKEYVVTRGRAEEEAVLGARPKADDRWDFWLDADRKLAYVRIARFAGKDWNEWDTPDDLTEALDALHKDGLKGLVLDLRFTKGGLLISAVDSSELFLKKGSVVTALHTRSHGPEEIRTKHEGKFLNLPIVCLVNGETARAAEVFVACLHDNRGAVVMGERTAGECGLQNIRLLSDEPASDLRLTTGSLFRPDGKKLYKAHMPGFDDDEWGVFPDPKYLLRLPAEERQALADHLDRQTFIPPSDRYGKQNESAFKDRQLQMALEYLRSKCEKP